MTRNEYNEFRYIRKTLKGLTLSYGTTLTIRTNGGPEVKQALDALYTGLNFHPASIRVDNHFFDDQERILYIYNRTWQDNEGRDHDWSELYTAEEKARFEEALQ